LVGLTDGEGVNPVGVLVGDAVACLVGFGVGCLRMIVVYGFLVGRGVGSKVVNGVVGEFVGFRLYRIVKGWRVGFGVGSFSPRTSTVTPAKITVLKRRRDKIVMLVLICTTI